MTSFASKSERLMTLLSLYQSKFHSNDSREKLARVFDRIDGLFFCPQTFPLKTKKKEMRLKKTASQTPTRTRMDSASTGQATATATTTTTTADTHPRSPAHSRVARKNSSMKVSFYIEERTAQLAYINSTRARSGGRAGVQRAT